MAKAQRTGRVFIDWSQNNPAETTIAAYSLRGREHLTVSTVPPTSATVIQRCLSGNGSPRLCCSPRSVDCSLSTSVGNANVRPCFDCAG